MDCVLTRYVGQPSWFNLAWPGFSIWKYCVLSTCSFYLVKLGWLVNLCSCTTTCFGNGRLKHGCRMSPLLRRHTRGHPDHENQGYQSPGIFEWWVSEIWLMSTKCRGYWKSRLIMIDEGGQVEQVLKTKVRAAFPESSKWNQKGAIWFCLVWEFLDPQILPISCPQC